MQANMLLGRLVLVLAYVCLTILPVWAHAELITFGSERNNEFTFTPSQENVIPVMISGEEEVVDAINLIVEVVGVSGPPPEDAIESMTRITSGPFPSAIDSPPFDGPADQTTGVGTAWLGPRLRQPFPELPTDPQPFASLSLDTSSVEASKATWELRFVGTAGSGNTDILRAGSSLNPDLGTATVHIVPEPSMITLAAIGLLVMGAMGMIRPQRKT